MSIQAPGYREGTGLPVATSLMENDTSAYSPSLGSGEEGSRGFALKVISTPLATTVSRFRTVFAGEASGDGPGVEARTEVHASARQTATTGAAVRNGER